MAVMRTGIAILDLLLNLWIDPFGIPRSWECPIWGSSLYLQIYGWPFTDCI